MAGGWAPDGAEQAQIDANLDDALAADVQAEFEKAGGAVQVQTYFDS